jgi:hypothetical protein
MQDGHPPPPPISLPVKPSAWAVPLYPKSQPLVQPISAAVLQRPCAWDVPLIPKIVATSNIPNNTVDQPVLSQPEEQLEKESEVSSSNEDHDACKDRDEDSIIFRDEDSIRLNHDTAKQRTRRARKRYSYCQGLFVAEMSNGVHISLGQCWATAHYNSLRPQSPPLYVVHMAVPMRLT